MISLLDIVKSRRGMISKIAVEAGVTHGAVSQWLRSRVPAERVLIVEAVSGVPREEIRPDVFKPTLVTLTSNASEKTENTSEFSVLHSEGDL